MIELVLLLISLLVIAAGSIFVAAEFSLLAVNRNSVEAKAHRGDKRAKGVLHALKTLSTQLSSAQVGITVTNLALGYLAEPAIARLIRPWLEVAGVPEQMTFGISVTIGLLLATFVTMIFGELVPKNIAIARPYSTAAFIQAPLLFFTHVMHLPIRVLNKSANVILGWFGVQATEELASARSADELLSLVRRSAERGTLPRETAAMMERTVNFGELTALDVMTPRLRIQALPRTHTAADVLKLAQKTGRSRFPVYDKTLDDICGIVHVKHALRLARGARTSTQIGTIMVKPLLVPSSISLEALLDDLREDGLQMAIAVDEFGAVDGVVTIENLLEELVGDLKDEHDTMGVQVQAAGDGSWEISGLLRPDELAESTDIYLPEHEDVETIAGLVAHNLERIPKVGDKVKATGVNREGNEVTVTLEVLKMEGHRVDRLRVRQGGVR